MTLKEAMTYRGENEETLAKVLDTRPLDVRRWCKPARAFKAECSTAAAAGRGAGRRGADHRRRCGV